MLFFKFYECQKVSVVFSIWLVRLTPFRANIEYGVRAFKTAKTQTVLSEICSSLEADKKRKVGWLDSSPCKWSE